MTNGIKQGTVLSQLLFIMYIDGLFYELKRAISKLPIRTHNYIVCGTVESVNIILDCRIVTYILNVINSDNITVSSFINTFFNCESSVFAEKYRYSMYKYNILYNHS